MANKDKYLIIINKSDTKNSKYCFSYSFGNTKNIIIKLKKNSASVEFDQTSSRSKETILNGNDKLFNDSIKKIMLLHQILYNYSLNIHSICIRKNNEPFVDIDENPIVSMIEQSETKFDKKWEKLIDVILNTPSSKEDERSASIKNIILASSEQSSAVRFLYSWMALNGFYKRISHVAINLYGSAYPKFKKAFTRDEDLKQIRLLSRMEFGKNYHPDDNRKKSILNTAMSILRKIETNITKDDLTTVSLNTKDNIINKNLTELPLEENDGYTCACFMLLWLPYQIRCSYIHSDKTLPIYVHKNDSLLKILDILSKIIINFLVENIPEWYVDEINTSNLKKLENAVSMEWKQYYDSKM